MLTEYGRVKQTNSVREGVRAFASCRLGGSLVEMQVDGRWKDSRMPSYYVSAEIGKNSAMAGIKYGKVR